MKGELYQSDLEFIEKAKKAFESNYKQVSYFNDTDSLIALRYGADNDCIRLFELGSEKAFFHNIMKKCPVDIVLKADNESEYGDSHMFID